ncbi:EAL domain-containing protein [Quadrisphaera sp. GCM10027208]|uniref:EAL domain-containing protein n=1 Tax=Quadrisphaera sp. GCM10027208 TaxID=3273423 RepID=UPI0036151C86
MREDRETSGRTWVPMGRALAASTRLPWPVAGALTAAWIAGAWLATLAAGGSRTVLPHLFYVPVILAASRFGWRGATLTAVAAGLVAGPLTPVDVASWTPQPVLNWMGRLVAFLVVGNLVAWLTAESHWSVVQRVHDVRVSASIQRALARGELWVAYQPVVELDSGRVRSFEALCRWTHPQRGPVPPAEFIPAAERTPVIHRVGAFVLRTALARLAEMLRDDDRLVMSVNVSAAQLTDPGFVATVRRALWEADVPAPRLCLELTETAILADVPAAVRQLKALRALGVLIALDDFGAGESSLAYLHQFDVDIVKVDRSFVAAAPGNPKSTRMVNGIVKLATSLGAVALAEGIETDAERDVLRAAGCHLGQGYLLGRPEDGAAAAQRVTAQRSAGGEGRLTRAARPSGPVDPPRGSRR